MANKERPPTKPPSTDWSSEIAQLAAKGLVTLPKSPKRPLGRRNGIVAKGSVSELVAEQRQ